MEVVRRAAAGMSWMFVLNHSAVEQRVPARGVDLVTGLPVDGEARIPAGGYAVIREIVTAESG